MNRFELLSPTGREELKELINYYFDDKTPLLKQQKEQYERIIEADNLLNDTSYKSDKERVERLSKKFNVSVATARRDIVKAMEFFTRVEVIDIATSFRLLLAKVKQYETLCKNANSLKELPKLLEIELKILERLAQEAKNEPPKIDKPLFLFLSGETAKANMNLPKYDHKAVVQFIEEQNIPDEDKERLVAELDQQ